MVQYDHDDYDDRPVPGLTPRRDHGGYDHDDQPAPGPAPIAQARWA